MKNTNAIKKKLNFLRKNTDTLLPRVTFITQGNKNTTHISHFDLNAAAETVKNRHQNSG